MVGGAAGGLWRHQQWWRNLSRHLGFYQELEIRLKPREMVFFFVLDMKIISTLLDFSRKIYFYVGKSWKNVYFHWKMAWPPPTYDVISRNHKNWPLLNLTQNAHEGWTNSYWKHQVLTFYPLGENSEKPYRVASAPPPPPPRTSEVKWYNLTFDSEDDYRTGLRNVRHYEPLSYWGHFKDDHIPTTCVLRVYW